MSELTELGYPQGYHMGLSAIVWWITIVVIAILGIILYLNAKKSDLINVKEMLRAKSFAYLCLTIQYFLIQLRIMVSYYFWEDVKCILHEHLLWDKSHAFEYQYQF